MLLFGVGSSVASCAILSFWTYSVRAVHSSHAQMLRRFRQQDVMTQAHANSADYEKKLQDLRILDPSAWKTFSGASFDKIFRKLQIDHHIADLRYSTSSFVSRTSDLVEFTLVLTAKSSRDRNIAEFCKQLVANIPGVVVFEQVQIEREGRIMSHSEFLEFLHPKGHPKSKKKKIPPAFSAKIQCKVVIPKALTQTS